MTSGGTAVAGQRPATVRTTAWVFPRVGGALWLLAAAVWIPVLIAQPAVPSQQPPWWAGLLLAGAFLASEVFPLRVEVRQDTVMVSLSELPLTVGVLLLPPWLVGAVNVAVGLAVYLVRRDRWYNDLLNLALVAVETGVAVGVMALWDAPAHDIQARYPAVTVAVLVGALVSVLAVGLSYRWTGTSERLTTIVARSMLSAISIVGLTLVGVATWKSGTAGPVLCCGLVLVVTILYRVYSSFLHQHGDLAKLYQFSQTVSAAGPETSGWQALVEQVRDQLNARAALLYLAEDASRPAALLTSAESGAAPPIPSPPDDLLLAAASSAGRVRAAADDQADRRFAGALSDRQARDVMVVVLRSGDRPLGLLEVRDRRSRWGRYSIDDLNLLQTLAANLATALDNSQLVDQLRYEAYHDPLTGLNNRRGLAVSAARMTAEPGGFGGVVLVELNVLAAVNNALGYDSGEHLLELAGDRLAEAAGPSRPVGRLESDRFAILLGRVSDLEAAAIADIVLRAAARPFRMDGLDVDPGVRAGIALRTSLDVTADTETLLRRAEMAVLEAVTRDEPLAVYRSAMGDGYRRRFQLVSQFRAAVDDGQIVLHYQPKLSLAERQLVGVEALVRWQHPEFGLVAPTEFVDAIEATGSIDVLFSHVLTTALSQVAAWLAQGRRIGVAVNLSARNLLAGDFPALVAAALAQHRVPAELLTLEITESSVMSQPEHSLPILRALHGMGVRLSVDDFGTGYSSLAYLRRLPIDEVKIDKSFVQGMVTDFGDLAIVRAIVELGHSLGLFVVAEGVEEEAGRDALVAMQCDAMQGYLLSRPLATDKFDAWLSTRTARITTAELQTGQPVIAPVRLLG